MTAALEHAPTPASRRADRDAGLAVTQRRLLRSEWIKLRTVRSTVVALASAALVLIGLGTLISAFSGDGDDGPGSGGGALTASLSGMLLAQLIVGVLGVLFVSTEYASGMIRATLAAVRSRTSILRAKALVLAAVVLAVTAVAVPVAVVLGNAVYAGTGATASLTDPEVLRAMLGAAVFAAGISVLGVGLGFLLRSAAGGISVLVALLLIAPLMIQLVPGSIGDGISKLLPSNAGESIMSVETPDDRLSVGPGLAVFVAWVLGFLVAGAVALRRRDA